MRTRRKRNGHSYRIMSAVRFEAEEETEYGSGGLACYALRFCGDWDCLLRSLAAGELSAFAAGAIPEPYVLV
jgi:hypothetical protein